MRRLTVLTATTLAGVAITAVPAAATVPINVHGAEDGTVIQYAGSGSSPAVVAPPMSKPVVRLTAAHRIPVFEVDEPILASVGPSFCVSYTASYVTDPTSQAAQTAANEPKWGALLSQFPPCPGVHVPGGRAAVSPQQMAAGFWASQGTNPLLRPAPRIRPGYGLAGETAYLETGGSNGQYFADPTGAGTLDIAATGTFWVDWGDGTPLAGPYSSTGGPWPNGDITHTWDNAGHYTVTVYETWHAVWHLGGQGGALGGLRTVGTIPGFEVRQLVSVRNR